MKCIVTAGPTFEPLDPVRRLTNFSSGKLGCRLAQFLAEQGHKVKLLLAEGATFRDAPGAQAVERFTTTCDLRDRLQAHSAEAPEAIFHAAAVSDFLFGKVFERGAAGKLVEVRSGKFSTRAGVLLAELVPTPKIIARLRQWFPKAYLAGWKYEIEGSRDDAIRKAREQISENRTDLCVANGPAYGLGFGLVRAEGECRHFSEATELYKALEKDWKTAAMD
jgi:phosphopantothenate---cysteine ligase (CTP)